MALNKILVSVIAFGLAFPSASFAKSHKSATARHRPAETSQHRRPYLLHHHVPGHYADPNGRRSPKWHPTKPHTGNWAD